MSEQDVIYVDTDQGAALFDSADVKGHFWTICRYFDSEKFLTYCGIASSVAVLNSLGVEAPDEPQIYPYKMFTQDNIFTDAVLGQGNGAVQCTDRDGFRVAKESRVLDRQPAENSSSGFSNLVPGHGDRVPLARPNSVRILSSLRNVP